MSPADPERYARDLAEAVNGLMVDGERRARMGEAGRRRAVAEFSWSAIADQTVALYRSWGCDRSNARRRARGARPRGPHAAGGPIDASNRA
jgi:hypothetical protein